MSIKTKGKGIEIGKLQFLEITKTCYLQGAYGTYLYPCTFFCSKIIMNSLIEIYFCWQSDVAKKIIAYYKKITMTA